MSAPIPKNNALPTRDSQLESLQRLLADKNERIAALEAQLTALSKPVSDEEWEHHRCGVELREENGDTCATHMTWRVDVDAIIAARLAATEPKL